MTKFAAGRQQLESAGLVAEKQALLERMQAANFWDVPETARASATRLHVVERMLEEGAALEAEVADLASWLPRIESERRIDSVRRAGERLLDAERRAKLWILRLKAASVREQGDAFVWLRQVGTQQSSVIETISRMYEGFAQRAGLDCVVTHRARRAALRVCCINQASKWPKCWATSMTKPQPS